MRASEFITEDDHFNGIELSLEIQKDDEYVDDEDYDNQVVYVTATSNGKELGHVLFSFDGEYLLPQDLEVDERFRGQGIAQTMYDYVKSKGYKIRRSGQQTDAGAGFWAKHRPEQNVWEAELDEAPLADYVPLGDFNKPGPFRSKVDKKLVTHPTAQLKTTKFFEQTPYDFRLFFSNIPGTAKSTELGAVDHETVRKILGDAAEQVIANSDDAITVVFLGNYGDQRVMMTPWIMAHRIGHAIQATGRRKGMDQWRTVEQHFFRAINQKLAEVYGKPTQRGVSDTDLDYMRTDYYNALFNAIGTQRSSREGQIKRPYEFMYEMFAQYIKTGTVTLNPFPEQLGYGKYTFGNQSQMKARGEEDLKQAAETLGYDMQLLFGDVLSMCNGQIFLM